MEFRMPDLIGVSQVVQLSLSLCHPRDPSCCLRPGPAYQPSNQSSWHPALPSFDLHCSQSYIFKTKMESCHLFLKPCTGFQSCLGTESKALNAVQQALQPTFPYLTILIPETPYPLHDLARAAFFTCLGCHFPSQSRRCIICAICLAHCSVTSPQPLILN